MDNLRQEILNGFASADLQSQAETDVAKGEETEKQTRDVSTVISAPNSYKQEFKDSFHTLSAEWQKYLSSREKEYEQGLSRARNAYGWIDKIATEKKDLIAARGFKNFEEYINTLIEVSDGLENNPEAALVKLEAAYGVKCAVNDNALQKQISSQNARIDELKANLQFFENERAVRELEAFANAKDENGRIKHVYLDELKEQMRLLIKAGLASSFEDAYNQALWRVENVREKVLADRAKAEFSRKENEAHKAKRASFEPESKNEGSARELSLREEIERNYNKLGV